MNRWGSVLAYLLIAGALIGIIVWRVEQKQADTAKQKQQRIARTKMPANVEWATVSVHDIANTYEGTGTLQAPLDVNLASKVTGRVIFLQVHEGDRVRKGQVLARIDSDAVTSQVNQAKADLQQAMFRLSQAKNLQAPNDSSVVTQIAQMKAGVASAEADYQQVTQTYNAQIQTAKNSILDGKSKVNSAKAAIDSAKANIDSAKANLDDATAKCDRDTSLYKDGFVAAQDVDDAKAAVAVQQAAVKAQQAALEVANQQLQSAVDEEQSAEQQLSIVTTTGKTNIDASDAKLKQAQSQLEYAIANKAATPAYQQNLAALKAAVVSAQAALATAMANKKDTVLVAPMDGAITARDVDPGATVTPGQAMLGMQFMHSLWATIAVPEEVEVTLHSYDQTIVRFDSLPGQSFTAPIIQLNPAADPTSRQFTVRVLLDNTRNQFKPGMFAKVTFVTERILKAITIPPEALQKNDADGSTYVNVIDSDNTVHQTPVTVGTSGVYYDLDSKQSTDYTVIQSGLTPKMKVVTMSAIPLKEGQQVTTGGRKGGKPGGKPDAAAGAGDGTDAARQPGMGGGQHHHHAPAGQDAATSGADTTGQPGATGGSDAVSTSGTVGAPDTKASSGAGDGTDTAGQPGAGGGQHHHHHAPAGQ